MPRIVVQQFDPSDFYHAGPLAAGIAHAGHDISEGIRKNRALDIEELRAKKQLQAEINRAKAGSEREAQVEAERTAILESARKEANARIGVQTREALKEAISTPGGALGPFGFLNTKAFQEGMGGAVAIEQQTQADLEQAARMTPAAATRFLDRRKKERKQEAIQTGYEKESIALQNALMDGKLEDPFLTPNWKPGQPPSEAAMKKAQELTKGLQDDLNAGNPPGRGHDEIVKAYNENAKLTRLYKDWEKADATAEEMLLQIRNIAANAPQGIDPITGDDMRAELVERVANAEAEWERTRAMSYRKSETPVKSLGDLQKILFGVEAKTNDEGFLSQRGQAARMRAFQTPSEEEIVQASTAMDPASAAARGPAGKAPAQARQAAPMGKKTDTGKRASDAEIEAGRPGREAERQARGLPGRTRTKGGKLRPVTNERDAKTLAGFVTERVRQTFQAGPGFDRLGATELMLEAVDKELGIDPNDPKALQIIREAIVQAYGR